MFIKNRDFVYIAVSTAFAQDCIGCKNAEDIIGKTDFDLFKDAELAAHYREDDKRLLASGKDMIEFAEEYVDNKGIIHYCFTAKYLICDDNNHPMAILGQYHDIDGQLKAELAQSRDRNQKATLALPRTFFVSNYVN